MFPHELYGVEVTILFVYLLNLLMFILLLCISAVCPYLALETCRQWRLSNKTVNLMRNGKMPTVTIEQAQRNFIKVCFFLASDLFVECCPLAPDRLNIADSNMSLLRLSP